ncbi:MAG: FAD:protein FMN transferase [Pirellulales bacterium]|nr:FAD:protein FMN transferase [Pirellulales bacterium]
MGGPPGDNVDLKRFEFDRTEMAVQFNIIMYAPDDATAADAAQAAFDRIHQLNDILSDYAEESELRQLCIHSSEGNAFSVSDDLWRVLNQALELSARTEGAFDATIGPLSRQWRRARRTKELPSAEALKSALARVDYRAIRLHPDRHAVELLKPNMLLDLGGIAKGFALGEAYKIVKSRGIGRVMLRAGGDMVLGDSPPGKPGWRIGVGQIDPEKPPRFHLWLSNVEIATSGDRFQFVEIGGKRYSHLIDPKTGLGITGQRQATVVVPRGTLADGLASSICIMGPEKGLPMLEKIPGAAAYLIHIPEQAGKEEIRQSSRWKNLPLAGEPR